MKVIPKKRSHTLVDKADREVSLVSMLVDFYNIDAADIEGYRTYCPEGMDHSDGGKTASLKLFPESNSAWCFSHSKRYSPASLARIYYGLRPVQAATRLLEHYGISTSPPTLEERWAALAAFEEDPLDVDSLQQGFLEFLQTLPGYYRHQYHPKVLDKVHSILTSTRTLPSPASVRTLQEWMSQQKKTMVDMWISEGFTDERLPDTLEN